MTHAVALRSEALTPDRTDAIVPRTIMMSSHRSLCFVVASIALCASACQLNYDPNAGDQHGGHGLPEAVLRDPPRTTHDLPEPLVQGQGRGGAGPGAFAGPEYYGGAGAGDHPQQVTLVVRPVRTPQLEANEPASR